jgi:diguanylate cyclase (GGDEF)-like protein/PAS domain S-box-containing protein
MNPRQWWGLGIGIALVLLAGVASIVNTQRIYRQVFWVAQSNSVLYALSDVLSLLQDLETGQRGFLLTGREAYLEPYHRAIANKEQTLVRLHGLIAERPHLLPMWPRLTSAVARKFDIAGKTVRLHQDQGFAAALQLVQTDEGKSAMDAVRAVLQQMQRSERNDLLVHERQAQRSDVVAIVGQGLIAALAALCLGAVGFGFMREAAAHVRTARLLQTERDSLAHKVDERTAELFALTGDLHAEKESYRITLASIGDAVITTDLHGTITGFNAIAERLTGWPTESALGQPLASVFHIVHEQTRDIADDPVAQCLREDQRTGLASHTCLVRRDGSEVAIDDSVAPIRDVHGQILGAVLIFRDVSEQRNLAERISYQATHDALTGLANRTEFETRLQRLLAATNAQNPHAVLYLDLDQFKVVNDTCGHAAGDELMRQVTARLHAKIRSRDTLARLGGDEFGVLLEHCPPAEALRLAQGLRQEVKDFRFCWKEQCFTLGVSIGLVAITEPDERIDRILSAADSACYAAKDAGRNRVHVYEADDDTLTKRRGEMQWVPQIQQALEQERFCLYYQPILSLTGQSRAIEHVEVLLRLKDEHGRIVLPGAFIPAAERYDQMTAIDRWVIHQALAALGQRTERQPKLCFAVNLSGRSLGNEAFLDYLTEELDEHPVAPECLCFEITETAAIANLTHAVRFINTMKARGCQFALDDFGSGLSSFGYLKTLPVDFIKIDGGFIKDINDDPIDRAMVKAIQQIAYTMGIKSVAESVETPESLVLLRGMNVDFAQGYAIARPAPLETL